MIAETFIRNIADAAGPVQDSFLSESQLAKADAAIDAQKAAAPADKLQSAMLKAFLRLPFENGGIAGALAQFAHADFQLANEKVEQNGIRPTSDTVIRTGSLPTDGWSLSHVVADTLAADPAYKDVAEKTGKQLAMLAYGVEKTSSYQAYPFDVLEAEFAKNAIQPFKKIHLLEFAGDKLSSLANQKRGIAKLLGSYRLQTGAGAGVAQSNAAQFVGASAPGIPAREEGVTAVIARNVFNFGAAEKDINPYENAQNLLAAFANALPDRGKLYVSTSLNDAIGLRDIPDMLAHTGFAPAGDAEMSNDGKTPSYVLERDFRIQDAGKITPAPIDNFTSLHWRRDEKPGQSGKREIGA